jgi:hypothetical protein
MIAYKLLLSDNFSYIKRGSCLVCL